MARPRLLPLLTAVLLAWPVAGCSGGADKVTAHQSPEEALAGAATRLDETSGVALTLTTSDLPAGVSGITRATGVATHAPAFEGTIAVVFAGQPVDVPVIAVDGKVWAVLPFTSGDYQRVDPREYGAPDPARFVDSELGFPSLLGVTTEVEEGDTVRGGTDNSEVLTTFTGTVPGSAVKKVIPSAAGQPFEAEYRVADNGELRQAVLTGVFYKGEPEMTYTVDFDDYGTEKDITAP